MMICLLAFVSTVQVVLAQENPQAEMEFNPEVKSYIFSKNSSVKLGPWDNGYLPFSFEKGKNWVFRYYFKSKEFKMVADDEYSETLAFQIPAQKGKSFQIKGDLRKYKVVYSPSCFCRDAGARDVKSGFIKGKKVGKDKWEIELILMVPQRDGKGAPTEKRFKGIYTLGSLENE